ncbi:MAG: metalloregulator ArsR/SmtB family transcription factor [Agriterribacter sp.]
MRRDVFQAIADPTRREIISMISRQSLNLNSIANEFKVSRQAISLHIKILTECGIILIEQQGRERYCTVQPEKLVEVDEWLKPFRDLWEDKFNRLDKVLQKLKNKKNGK